MAVWTTQYINNLPDSSFAYIADGGQKDSDGKTTPRALRKLPYKDANGNVDPAHTRNALARLDQTEGIPADAKDAVRKTLQNALAKVNNDAADGDGDEMPAMKMSIDEKVYQLNTIKLDNTGSLPNQIAILTTGNWPNSVKGNFTITVDDLRQIKANFDSGIGFPTEDSSTGLAIDFMHNYDEEAAGWIKALQLSVDPTDDSKATLYATVEWTDAGAAAVQGGQFKMISPSGYFGSKNGKTSMWANPNNLQEKAPNVLDGAGLTNIPFLRGMSPIRADRLDDNAYDNDNVIYVVTNQHKKEEQPMQLDAIRVKERKELSVPELDFLAENKEQLSATELEKFQLAATEETEAVSEEDRATLAAIKSGDKKLVDASVEPVDKSRLDALEQTAKQYQTEKAEGVVDLHIKRGAIKQDSREFWTKQLLGASSEADRKALEDQLAALPENEQLSKELGSADDTVASNTPREQLAVIANKMVEEANKAGEKLSYGEALKQAMRTNPDLANADLKDNKVKAGV